MLFINSMVTTIITLLSSMYALEEFKTQAPARIKGFMCMNEMGCPQLVFHYEKEIRR